MASWHGLKDRWPTASAIVGGVLVVIRFAADLGDAVAWGVGGIGALLIVVGILVLLYRGGILFALPFRGQEGGTWPNKGYFSKLMDDDRQYLVHRLRIKEIGVKVDRLISEEVDPYIELKLSLWNWSVFNVFCAEVDGHLSHNGQEMAGRVTKEGSSNAHHGHFCNVTVRQWVTQERATKLRDALETGRLELDLSRLRITFDVWLADADTRFQVEWSYQGTLAFKKECDWQAPPLGH